LILRSEIKPGDPLFLALAPTRELACQTENEANKFGVSAGIVTLCVYGGVPKHEQLRELKKGIHLLIATPGRLNDFLETERDSINLKGLKKLVVDEADRMLDMGFEPQIRKVIKECPEDRHTLFFTATWPDQVRRLATDFLNKPVQVRIGNTDLLKANDTITQLVKVIDGEKKVKELTKCFLQYNISEKGKGDNRALIFCNSKKMCEQLEDGLNRARVNCQSIHAIRTSKSVRRHWLICVMALQRSSAVPMLQHVVLM
jgi:ATP-dependent RNA helicase DDX5/DBP2